MSDKHVTASRCFTLGFFLILLAGIALAFHHSKEGPVSKSFALGDPSKSLRQGQKCSIYLKGQGKVTGQMAEKKEENLPQFHLQGYLKSSDSQWILLVQDEELLWIPRENVLWIKLKR